MAGQRKTENDIIARGPRAAAELQKTWPRCVRLRSSFECSRQREAMGSLFATALILLVTGLHLASCQDFVSRRRPVIRQARDVPTTGCYIVAMKDDTKEAEMQKVLTKAVKVSDDAKLYGMVQKVKKAFTVKLNPYALEMVRERERERERRKATS